MFFLRKNKRILSVFFVILITLPYILMASFPVYAVEGQQGSWLKGVLLMVISFIVNNFVEKNKASENSNSFVEEKPLVNINDQKGGSKEVLGFHVNWLTPEANSYTSLKENWQDIDIIAPFWYTVNPDGDIITRYGGHQYEVDSFAKNRNIKVIPLINNNQKNNMILVNPSTRTKAVNNIVDLVEKYKYDGVNIDFEHLPPYTRNSYTAFIKELSGKLRKNNKLLTISVFPKIDVPLDLQGAYDYAALGPLVDRLVIMTYDKNWSTGPAGPIAPIDWVEKNIRYSLEYIPAHKILLGIANYGYDWPSSGVAQDISAKKALKIAGERDAEIKWHTKFQSPYFYYWDKGQKHEVWFETGNSMAFKLELVNKYNLQGIAIWRLGNENDDFWDNIRNKIR